MRKFIRYAIILLGLSTLPLALSLPVWATTAVERASKSAGCQAWMMAALDGWQSAHDGYSISDRADHVLQNATLIYDKAGIRIKPSKATWMAFSLGAFWMGAFSEEAMGLPKVQVVTNMLAKAGCGESE